jgi:hypothetical protein
MNRRSKTPVSAHVVASSFIAILLIPLVFMDAISYLPRHLSWALTGAVIVNFIHMAVAGYTRNGSACTRKHIDKRNDS